eukprot:scaffold36844_cov58-Phaeocystis_antarctica.AAC.3
MQQMFAVRSSPCPAPNLQSSPPLHVACTVVAHRLPPLPARTSPRTVCPPCDSRQDATAFNQPLSFDTSSVTTMYRMYNMFYVRSSPCPAPQSAVEPCPARCVPRRRPPPPAFSPQTAPHYMPSLRLGRAQTPCPTPTSCSSGARGRAPRSSPMARAGVREPARRTEPSPRCV